jgi:hypothetical protein
MTIIPKPIFVGKTYCKYGLADTKWTPEEDAYFTAVVYKDGSESKEIYPHHTGLLGAQSGHKWWVQHLNNPICLKAVGEKELKPIKISMAAFLRIVYGWIGKGDLATKLDKIQDNIMYFTLLNSPMAGTCTYDMDKGEIVDITDFWRDLLNAQKEKILKRQIEQEILSTCWFASI